ncbi:hypothetical protein JCM5353_006737 [Sporobolomyces roseus]
MHRSHQSLWSHQLSLALLPTLFFLVPSLVAQRTFTIRNKCDYILWPAVTNYGTEKTQYTGVRGWEAEAGSVKELEIPSPWNGRIWARRECDFDGNGKGSCTTGNVAGGLEVDDQTIGDVNVGEFNLDAWGGNDFWDISCVPGWTVTMAIEPEPEECQSVICADDLNEACPDDRMKQLDKDGKVIGCLSACMAKINSEDPSINCCSGKYNSKEACHFGEVDYYQVLKPYCQNAYWYPYDFQPNSPTVDWSCPTSKNANYLVTFCPDGETTKNGDTIYEGGVTFVGEAGKETRIGGNGNSTKKNEETSSSAATGGSKGTSGSAQETTSKTDHDDDESSASTSRSATFEGSTIKPTLSSAPAPSSSLSTSYNSAESPIPDNTIFGYPRSTVYIACAILGLLIVSIGLLACRHGGGERASGRESRSLKVRSKRDVSSSDEDTDSSEESEKNLIGHSKQSFSVAASTERDITIKNNCDYTLWPAITSRREIQDSKYTGKRGWEAKAGSEEQVKVPGIWHGMIYIFEPKANFAEFLFEKDAVVDRWHISCWNGKCTPLTGDAYFFGY